MLWRDRVKSFGLLTQESVSLLDTLQEVYPEVSSPWQLACQGDDDGLLSFQEFKSLSEDMRKLKIR